MNEKAQPIICLMGPTASGKTDLALALADQLPVELISVDSALIYRGMNIGTAKPARNILEKYPHHIIDICEPTERYSAAEFCETVNTLITDIQQRNKIPLLVGGTMMYFNALFKGLAKLPDANLEIRKQLDACIQEKGSDYLHKILKQVDPISAEKIHPNDPQRLQRALEVYQITGKPMSAFWEQKEQQTTRHYLKLAISPIDRKVLHMRIEQRFDQMLEQGFLNEVKQLMQHQDLSLDLPSMRCVGYRQAWQHLSQDYDLATMREKAIIATRQLAKRQLTWLRSFDNIHWLDSCDDQLITNALNIIKAVLAKDLGH